MRVYAQASFVGFVPKPFGNLHGVDLEAFPPCDSSDALPLFRTFKFGAASDAPWPKMPLKPVPLRFLSLWFSFLAFAQDIPPFRLRGPDLESNYPLTGCRLNRSTQHRR
jgi:hypothetical protein